MNEAIPFCVLPVRLVLPAWAFMWLLAVVIFAGCKWWTLRCWLAGGPGRSVRPVQLKADSSSRRFAYLLAWPGLDARSFLGSSKNVPRPSLAAWLAVLLKIAFGAVMLWIVPRSIPAAYPLAAGWCGMIGLVFLLHFGLFNLLALTWQQRGINARPLMAAPIRATSLGEFWGRRWNSAFNQLAHDSLFRPLRRRLDVSTATLGVFLASGLVHDLVISVPARGGYGLPTLYFLIQGFAVLLERSRFGRVLHLRGGLRGWFFTFIVTAGPAYWLFHPPFVTRVFLPFLRVIHAL